MSSVRGLRRERPRRATIKRNRLHRRGHIPKRKNLKPNQAPRLNCWAPETTLHAGSQAPPACDPPPRTSALTYNSVADTVFLRASRCTATVLQPRQDIVVRIRKRLWLNTEISAYFSHVLVRGRTSRYVTPGTSNPPVAGSNPARRAYYLSPGFVRAHRSRGYSHLFLGDPSVRNSFRNDLKTMAA
jgi:hypothetical protein